MEPELLTAEQVGQILGCSAKTVRRLVALGQLGRPYPVADSLVRWSRAQVNTYLQRLQAREFDAPQAPAPEEK